MGFMIIATFDDDGEETETRVPARFEICSRCRGEGKHCNPNIDGNGITSDEWADWDEDEREGYMTGRYDVACDAGCEDGKVRVPDVEHASPALRAIVDAWEEQQRERAAWDAEDRHTRRMEGGGW